MVSLLEPAQPPHFRKVRFESRAAGVVCAGLQEKWQAAQFATRLQGATNEAALGLAEGAAHLHTCVRC